ncbi:MAG: hypothetical protein QM635_00070 [Microbacteriaceae bacterium]
MLIVFLAPTPAAANNCSGSPDASDDRAGLLKEVISHSGGFE